MWLGTNIELATHTPKQALQS